MSERLPAHRVQTRRSGVGIMTAALDLRERRAYQEQLAESATRLRALVEHADDVIAVLGTDGILRSWNRSLEHLLQYERYDAADVADFVHPDDLGEFRSVMEQTQAAPGSHTRVELRIRHADGSWRWFEAAATFPEDQRGVGGIVVKARDVTDRRAMEHAANRSARQHAAVAQLGMRALREESIPELFDVAAETLATTLGVDFVYAARATDGDELEFTTTWGWQPRVLGLTLPRRPGRAGAIAAPDSGPRTTVLTPERAAAIDASFADARSVAEVAIQGAHGTFGVLGVARRDDSRFEDDALHFVHAVANVLAGAVDRVFAAAELTRRSFHDPLTGLANRARLLDRIGQALAWQQRNGRQIALLLLNLDRFQAVNDSLGHDVGDELLRTVAQRLSASTRAQDTVAHLGGDDFAVLAERVADVHEAVDVATRLRRSLSQPIYVAGQELTVTATIGVAVDGEEWADALAVLRDADTALHWGKQRGGNGFEIYDPTMRHLAQQRLDLESDLRRALLAGELRTWFQPQLSVATGELVGAEALVRWERPGGRFMPPDEFLPVARETGLMNAIDEQVLTEAVERLAQWPDAQRRRVSVNVGPRHLTAPGLDRFIAELLARNGVRPDQLCLEITEHMLLDDIDSARVALGAIHALGVRIALDDFGTGYSSLQHITHLPIDEVKIDRSFVQDIHTDDASRAVVAAVVAMATALGVHVVAEGVETEEHLRVISELGCDAGQGFLWSPAVPVTQLGVWFAPTAVAQPRNGRKNARTSSMSRSGSSSAAK